MRLSLQEIQQIDLEPFDDDVIEELCHPEMMMTFRDQNILASLVSLYFRKFGEKYDINLSFSIPNLYYEFEFDGDIDDMHWYYLASSLFDCAMNELRWSSYYINLGDLEFETERREADNPEHFKEYLKTVLGGQNLEPNVVEMVMRESELVHDSVNYMDYGYCLFFWNDKLSTYLSYTGNEQAKNMCEEECKKIDSLIEDIWTPFLYYYDYCRGEANGMHYQSCRLGSDGHSSVEEMAFNPNWVCKAFVLDKLLDIALEKLSECDIENMAA